MGRMKEIYIQMLNEKFDDDNISAQLKEEARKMYEAYSPSEILCPNCMKEKLIQNDNVNMKCFKCGYDFIKIDEKTVKYK